MSYALSRFNTVRRPTREVVVGGVGIGGHNPVRLQSMTTTNTLDVPATVAQCIRLAEAGSELIRITAPTVEAARALRDIHREFRAAGFSQPLVADIHFLPAAAMEAIEHVEKVRINPGNYADKRRAFPRDFTDAEYAEELERVAEAVSPLIRRAKELGRALRIGTNHGSLSERTLNRYGDTPAGMTAAAMEFVRICEGEGFYDIVLSMKSSNTKVMIEAYRLAVREMRENGMSYPLHLGVTEAGEGEDARIKSAVGIGSLLLDGIGDTIRVSLTEDPCREIPVCREIASRIEKIRTTLSDPHPVPAPVRDTGVAAYSFRRRKIGFVFQAYHMLPELSICENVMLPAMLDGMMKKEAREKACTLLERVGLAHRLKHRAGELSGGEQQRAAIARSLMNAPELLLADEPTGNLDSVTGQGILDIFQELHANAGVTILMVTHDKFVAGLADRTVELKDGMLRAEPPPEG